MAQSATRSALCGDFGSGVAGRAKGGVGGPTRCGCVPCTQGDSVRANVCGLGVCAAVAEDTVRWGVDPGAGDVRTGCVWVRDRCMCVPGGVFGVGASASVETGANRRRVCPGAEDTGTGVGSGASVETGTSRRRVCPGAEDTGTVGCVRVRDLRLGAEWGQSVCAGRAENTGGGCVRAVHAQC